MQAVIKASIVAAGICLLSAPFLIPVLRRLKFGQHIRRDGPQGHLKKSGTPTMGGVMFFFSLSLGVVFSMKPDNDLAAALLVTLGFGLIGFFDDFIKMVMKRPLGLRAREKIVGQVLLSGVFACAVAAYGGRGTEVFFPGTEWSLQLGWMYIPFAILVMVSTVNAVNLADGLDGLAAGVTLFAALGYLLIARAWGLEGIMVFSASLIGTCLGFLFFNINPARLFMGDTGAFILGAALGSMAVLTKTELLLPVLGGVFVIETISVVIQVAYFRLTGGKRFFRMSPLHHHFELSGWPEQKVVLAFWTAAAAFAGLAVAAVLY
ncbi:MAG: phospho-N-acetylmuramoyl-pentapeptide-transferase [Peptococcaceae bacterium]|nr:phospho-N-acetylmuramoyl-pentapeptide-transferase [Peptococcaceae bacterium]MDH7524359.1 phospho-N-acetylmuramoyl-pentapeptide-transferase [Peptococcaceae bacterium]